MPTFYCPTCRLLVAPNFPTPIEGISMMITMRCERCKGNLAPYDFSTQLLADSKGIAPVIIIRKMLEFVRDELDLMQHLIDTDKPDKKGNDGLTMQYGARDELDKVLKQFEKIMMGYEEEVKSDGKTGTEA